MTLPGCHHSMSSDVGLKEDRKICCGSLRGLTRLRCMEAMVPRGTAVLKNVGRGGVCCSLRRSR